MDVKRRMKQEERARQVRAAAEAMADATGRVDARSLAAATGLSLEWVIVICRDMRLAGWHIRATGRARRANVATGRASAKGLDLVDPARVEQVRAEALAPMGDGRGELDDPPFGLAPRSGKDHRGPTRTRAELCRAYLAEYRRIRRGRRGPVVVKFAEHRSIQCVSKGSRIPWSTA